MLLPKKVFIFWYLILVAGSILVSMYRSMKMGKLPKIRKIAGLDAIEEAIGRATEMGRPVHFCPGIGGITEIDAAQTFAALALLGHIARLTAKFDVQLIVTIRTPEVLPLAEETVTQAYVAEGKMDSFNADDIRFLSSQQFAYAAAVFGMIMREKPAANFLLGAFWAESLMLAEVGSFVGAIQIAGTAQLSQVPFFVASCDYTLIGEELFTGAAYISQNPAQLGSIRGQDIGKAASIILIVLGVVLRLAGNKFLEDLMKL